MELVSDQDKKLLPFLKWAGGKRWLVKNAPDLVPEFSGTYYEPFLGSGAMFFHVSPSRSILSDQNVELINAYCAIKRDWRAVVDVLKAHHRNHSKEYYYKVRGASPVKPHTRAARFIYLNRTCWNGLYRVNRDGYFNVPVGTKKNVILDSDDFEAVSHALRNTELLHGDFENTLNCAGKGDFVFVDPPYTVKHNNNGFIKYNENLFSWDDQVRLKRAIDRAVVRGALVLVSNADHDSVRDLYSEYRQISMDRMSILSGKPEFRGQYAELIVQCGYV